MILKLIQKQWITKEKTHYSGKSDLTNSTSLGCVKILVFEPSGHVNAFFKIVKKKKKVA